MAPCNAVLSEETGEVPVRRTENELKLACTASLAEERLRARHVFICLYRIA